MRTREIDERYDPDLQAALERGGERELARILNVLCHCGHPRRDHMAASGALGSFGGAACDECFCPTYRPVDSDVYELLGQSLLELEAKHRRERDRRAAGGVA